ncbi:DUF1565 domain-containing protein [Gracilibacillus caseinilyticus]|uniref:DUF1565 domain-containing protein n=1 Tax=Gracilibacillus caseinilyticus TaxID=2932256 RepID=A0ABY4F1V4_9BACI|nr:DUF1565 domain-containing protein [Gracilibacillus caseinilyticus]UOQ49844.1 DUF1565 domain-containing protein [Gracilibacillus caseinilyticus]
MKKISLTLIGVMFAVIFMTGTVYANEENHTYFISPTGSDSNPGTKGEPFKSLEKAQSQASNGDTVYIREGVYDEFEINESDNPLEDVFHYVNDIYKSGITYEAYPGDERPVFDFSDMPTDQRVIGFYVGEDVTDINFEGFDVTGIKVGEQKQAAAFRMMGEANFWNMSVHDNEAIGFYYAGGNASGIVYNSDAYNNIGPTSRSAGNIDGFGAHGKEVLFINNRAWNNSDDGFDSISSEGNVIFHGNWSFQHLGNQDGRGDKNGFKVGGYSYNTTGLPDPLPVHTVQYNLAANNGGNNFYANHQPGQSAYWYHNTAYHPGYGSNFNMLERVSPSSEEDIAGYREVLHGNIAYEGVLTSNNNTPPENETNNSWTIDGGLPLTSEDFYSLDMSELTAPRKADGSLPEVSFMEPVQTSPLYEHNLGYLAYQKDPLLALQRLVTVFIENGMIDNLGISNSLQKKLAYDHVPSFSNQVQAQSGKHIDDGVARVLQHEAEDLLNE